MNFDFLFAAKNFLQAVLGIPTTLLITAFALFAGLPCAFFIALARLNHVPVLHKIAGLYISFVRGTPVVVQIFLVYNILPVLLRKLFAALSVGYDIYRINPIFYAFFVFGVNASATYSEMWKSSLSAVGKKQLEAAYAVGLTAFSAYRHIIIPQALAVAAPSLCSSTLTMLKNTSLVFIMTVQDITARAKMAAGIEYKYVEGYLDIFVTYLIVCCALERFFRWVERRLSIYKQTGGREAGIASGK